MDMLYKTHASQDAVETLLSESTAYGFDDMVNAPPLVRLNIPGNLARVLCILPALWHAALQKRPPLFLLDAPIVSAVRALRPSCLNNPHGRRMSAAVGLRV